MGTSRIDVGTWSGSRSLYECCLALLLAVAVAASAHATSEGPGVYYLQHACKGVSIATANLMLMPAESNSYRREGDSLCYEVQVLTVTGSAEDPWDWLDFPVTDWMYDHIHNIGAGWAQLPEHPTWMPRVHLVGPPPIHKYKVARCTRPLAGLPSWVQPELVYHHNVWLEKSVESSTVIANTEKGFFALDMEYALVMATIYLVRHIRIDVAGRVLEDADLGTCTLESNVGEPRYRTVQRNIELNDWRKYHLFFRNCQHWANAVLD